MGRLWRTVSLDRGGTDFGRPTSGIVTGAAARVKHSAGTSNITLSRFGMQSIGSCLLFELQRIFVRPLATNPRTFTPHHFHNTLPYDNITQPIPAILKAVPKSPMAQISYELSPAVVAQRLDSGEGQITQALPIPTTSSAPIETWELWHG